jgi:hypothetical protein
MPRYDTPYPSLRRVKEVTYAARKANYFRNEPAAIRDEWPSLVRATNAVQQILATGKYDGAIWNEGSPRLLHPGEEAHTPKPCMNSLQTHRWREADSNFQFLDEVQHFTPPRRHSSFSASSRNASGTERKAPNATEA